MKEKTDQEKIEAYNRLREGARKGGLVRNKKFTPESKERQILGATRGGLADKHFTPESKERQRNGAKIGGLKGSASRWHSQPED